MGAESIGSDNRRKRESFKLMRALGDWFHPAVLTTIESKYDIIDRSIDGIFISYNIQIMFIDLNLSTSTLNRKQKRWEDDVLKLLAACVTAVNDTDWRSQLAAVMGKQLALYNNYPDEKVGLF